MLEALLRLDQVTTAGGPVVLAEKVAVGFKGFHVENLKHVGWRLFRAETLVNWCGHGQEIIPLPMPDGRVTFVGDRCWGRRGSFRRPYRPRSVDCDQPRSSTR